LVNGRGSMGHRDDVVGQTTYQLPSQYPEYFNGRANVGLVKMPDYRQSKNPKSDQGRNITDSVHIKYGRARKLYLTHQPNNAKHIENYFNKIEYSTKMTKSE